MLDLLELEKHFMNAHIRPGDTVVDYTMGNGFDTEYLSKAVGPTGHVYAFDIQALALEHTKAHLLETGCPENYTLIQASHHRVKEFVTGPVRAGMFNLGYMPRSGHKELTTRRETTLPAVAAAIDLLGPDGILLVAVYPGHAEGEAEGIAIEAYLSTLSRFKMTVGKFRLLNSPTSPYFMIVETK